MEAATKGIGPTEPEARSESSPKLEPEGRAIRRAAACAVCPIRLSESEPQMLFSFIGSWMETGRGPKRETRRISEPTPPDHAVHAWQPDRSRSESPIRNQYGSTTRKRQHP